MSAALRAQFVASCLALAAVTGCTGGSGNPGSPSGAGATIAGTVSRSIQSPGLTVAVVGTDLSAVVESSGYFQIGRVPSGDVQLKFKDAAIDATARALERRSGRIHRDPGAGQRQQRHHRERKPIEREGIALPSHGQRRISPH